MVFAKFDLLLGAMFSFAGRLVLVRSQHYPRWLARSLLIE